MLKRGFTAFATSFLIAVVFLEAISWALLRFYFKADENLQMAQVSSGYTIFKQAPYYHEYTYCPDSNSREIVTDGLGFITDGFDVRKPHHPNEVRIFLTGGSAAFGAGQVEEYKAIHAYPNATYAYNISIAGFLQKTLQEKYPGKQIHVINAACPGRLLEQSLHQFLSVIEPLHPDIVISLDGFNDIPVITTGWAGELLSDIYQQQMSPFTELMPGPHDILHTIKLYKLLLLHYANQHRDPGYTRPKYQQLSKGQYSDIKPDLMLNAHRFVNSAAHFKSILERDSVKYIFCLQPMLHRSTNKKLNNAEAKFRTAVNPIFSVPDLGRLPEKYCITSSLDKDSLNTAMNLALMYMLDDTLSQMLRKELTTTNTAFIDANEQISHLSQDDELYTDYCHLTQLGNKTIADILASSITQRGFIQ